MTKNITVDGGSLRPSQLGKYYVKNSFVMKSFQQQQQQIGLKARSPLNHEKLDYFAAQRQHLGKHALLDSMSLTCPTNVVFFLH